LISYWLLFLPFAFRSLTHPKEKWNNATFISIIIFLVLFIGLRYDVGTDSGNYEVVLVKVRNTANNIFMKEYFFYLLCKLSLYLNWGVTGVNLFSSVFFSAGLASYCRTLPRPWLGLVISIPYLVIAVGMGYTKQSISLGLILYGLTLLHRKKIIQYSLVILISALFHLTSIIGLFLLVPFLVRKKDFSNKLFMLAVSALSFLGLYFLFIKRFLNMYLYVYLENEIMTSEGVFIRLAMVGIPSLVFLFFSNRANPENNQLIIYKCFAYYSLALVFINPFYPSTLVDRLALYGLPILIYVGGNFHDYRIVLMSKKYISIFLILLSIATQFVWLNFAGNAYAWKPYQNAIIRFFENKILNEDIWL